MTGGLEPREVVAGRPCHGLRSLSVVSEAGARVDCTAWPIVLITLPKDLTDADLPSLITDLTALYSRGLPFVVVYDVRSNDSMTAEMRRRMAAASDQNEATYPGLLLGTAIVLSTTFQRGIFTAMTWLTERQRRREAFANVDEAMRWGSSLLRAAGADTPNK